MLHEVVTIWVGATEAPEPHSRIEAQDDEQVACVDWEDSDEGDERDDGLHEESKSLLLKALDPKHGKKYKVRFLYRGV